MSGAEKNSVPEGKIEEKKINRFRKDWKKIAVVVAVALLLLLFVGMLFLDYIVANAIRTIGSKVTGTPVTVESVGISIMHSRLEINKLRIGNPAGYSMKDAFAIDRFVVDIDGSTLFSDTLNIEEITLNRMNVDFEMSLKKISNLNELWHNVKRFLGGDSAPDVKDGEKSGGDKKPKTADTGSKTAGNDKEIIIGVLSVNDVSVSFGSNVTVPLPPVHMTDIGKSRISEVCDRFFTELLKSIGTQVGKANVIVTDSLQKTISGGEKEINKGIKRIKKLFK